MSTQEPTIAVIICTRDRLADLIACLKGIENQSVQPSEVIIVSGSGESCPDDIDIRFQSLPIKVVDCYEHNISISRNKGLGSVSSRFVMFIDDDAIAHEDWLQQSLKTFDANPGAWAIGGDVYDSRMSPPSIEFSRGLVSSFGRQIAVCSGTGDKKYRRYVTNVKGCNFGICRERVMKLGGFDPFFAFAFDESDLMMSIHEHGGLVVHSPSVVVDHAHTPGHFRQRHPLDRDWRVEYASHTMFMLKHTPKPRRMYGRLVIRRRYMKLVVVVGLGAITGSIPLSRAAEILRDAQRGIFESHNEFGTLHNQRHSFTKW